MTFLPNNYEVPKAPSDYMKFKIGKNRFRVLTDAVTGWQYWNIEGKPVRQKGPYDFIPDDIRTSTDGRIEEPKHFWAFVVWNYDDSRIQILEIPQPSIQRSLKTKIDNRNGVATNADIIVTRTGSGFDTKYEVDMLDSSPTSPEILAAFNAKLINLEALFTGDNPFETDASHATQMKEEKVGEKIAKDIPF